ncbi:MAG: zinc ribbon domain-containing protein [Desulfobacteraceae bacterium]|nr:zinc ribbon domain-containing protein [Desulfobacteraceae bacterium]
MPIYEFKCHKCNECTEILVMGENDKDIEMKCSSCGQGPLERILSTASYAISGSGPGGSQANTQSRTCSGGSCTTWNLPGHSR